MNFQTFMNTLTWRDYKRIRAEIIHDTGITPQTWRNWYCTGSVPKKIYRQSINRVLAHNGFCKIYDV